VPKKEPREPVVLVIDIGGSNIKLRKSDSPHTLKFESGRKMTPSEMVVQALGLTAKWDYDVISIGFAGPVIHGKPAGDPQNLGPGWTDFDFRKAFRKPVKLINDAAMQALGCYTGGRMLFLGLGTGVGSTLILDEVVVPLELGQLRYSRNQTLEDVLGKTALKTNGAEKWERAVHGAVANLHKAFAADYVVLGGGNAKKLKRLPKDTRRGSNRYAFQGGVRLWKKAPLTPEVREHTLVIA
jgi:polyphosphate glucokinase